MSGADEPRSKNPRRITSTVGKVLDAREPVLRLALQPVGFATAQKIGRLKERVVEISAAFGEKRDAVAAEMGTEVGPQRWKIEPQQLPEFEARITELMKAEIQIKRSICLSMTDLRDARLSADDLTNMAFLVLDYE